MTKITFFPLGNADSTLLRFADGRMILKDYCNYESAGDSDRRIRLDEELRSCLQDERRDEFDVVAFSHADDDHTHAAEDFFWLDFAEAYQGLGRVRIPELWVPACFIVDRGHDVGRSSQVAWRQTIAERQRAIFRSEKAAILIHESAAARFDVDVGRQATVARADPFGESRAEERIIHAAVLGIAALNRIANACLLQPQRLRPGYRTKSSASDLPVRPAPSHDATDTLPRT